MSDNGLCNCEQSLLYLDLMNQMIKAHFSNDVPRGQEVFAKMKKASDAAVRGEARVIMLKDLDIVSKTFGDGQ